MPQVFTYDILDKDGRVIHTARVLSTSEVGRALAKYIPKNPETPLTVEEVGIIVTEVKEVAHA